MRVCERCDAWYRARFNLALVLVSVLAEKKKNGRLDDGTADKRTNGSRAAVLATSKLFSTTVKSKPFPLKCLEFRESIVPRWTGPC